MKLKSALLLPALLLIAAIGVMACGKEIPSKEGPIAEVTPPKPQSPPPLKTSFNDTRVVMLGTGTPVPDHRRSGPSTAIVANGQAYIVDFGPGVVRRANQAGLDVTRINTAFVTHLHSDHTAGYPDLILTPASIGRSAPLEVWGPAGLAKMTDHILAAYSEDLGVRAQERPNSVMTGYQVIPHEIEAGVVYRDKNVKVTAFDVKHGSWKNAFGLRFDTKDRSIVISGDTSPTENVIKACDGCDVLIHEVYCKAGFDQGPKDWQKYHANFHTSAPELGQLATEARPGLLILHHLLFFGCTEQQLLDEVRSNYKGEVVLGEDLMDY